MAQIQVQLPGDSDDVYGFSSKYHYPRAELCLDSRDLPKNKALHSKSF